MAIVSCNEISDRSYTGELEKAQRKYTRTFRVVTDSVDDSVLTVTGAACIPVLGTAYITAQEADAGALMKRIDAKPESGDPLVWLVSCDYDTEVPDPDDQEESPTARPAKYKFGFEKVAVAIQQDLDGRSVTNSAGQPFLPPQEIEVTRPTISIELNKATFSYAFISNIMDCVNSVTWNGFPVGTVKVDSVEANSEHENNETFWKLNWQLSVNWEGWIPTKILDAGFYEIAPGTSSSSYFSSYIPGSIDSSGWATTGTQPRIRQIRDAFGSPLNSPQLLCGGRALPPEFSQFPCYRYFRFYRWNDFTGVGV